MPLTASTALAARIDRAELTLVMGMADAMRATGAHVDAWPIGGSFAVLGEADSPFNKVIGLGFDGLPDAAELDTIERGHAARRARLQVELATLADPAVGRLLTSRGYRLIGFENVLARRLDQVATAAAEGIGIVEVDADSSARWITTVTEAFLQADVFDGPASHESFDRSTLERTYQLLGAIPGFVRMIAHRQRGRGGGALYTHEGIALMCGASTLPAHRRRGVQSALLHARLVHARSVGCELAVVTTQPGSKSQENVQRAGFELI